LGMQSQRVVTNNKEKVPLWLWLQSRKCSKCLTLVYKMLMFAYNAPQHSNVAQGFGMTALLVGLIKGHHPWFSGVSGCTFFRKKQMEWNGTTTSPKYLSTGLPGLSKRGLFEGIPFIFFSHLSRASSSSPFQGKDNRVKTKRVALPE